MPRNRSRPPADKIELELLSALERIKEGRPEDPALSIKAKLSRLKLNFSTVAKEAGRSRTSIAYENCRYPRVRAAVQAAMEPIVETRTAEAVILRLRQENAELKKALKQSDSQNAALVLRLRELEKATQREISAAERRANVKGTNPNSVAGQSFETSPVKIFTLVKDDAYP